MSGIDKIEKLNLIFNSKAENVMNVKLISYLSFIREQRKFHNFSDDIKALATKKRSLKVKIKKGNNSQLIR